MSRFYVLLVNVIVVAITMISGVITSEKINHGLNQIEKPIVSRIGNVSPQDRVVVPFTESSSIFFLHLLKYKQQYQKLDRIPTTTAAPVTPACICVPFYLCDSNQTIITDGAGIIDLRSSQRRRCTGDLEVCCYPRNTTTTMTIPTITFPTILPTITVPTIPPTVPTVTFPTAPPTTPPTTSPTTMPTVTFPTPTNPPTTIFPNCICVVISLCDPNGIVTISGEGIINPRYGLCPGNLVCCRILVNTTTTQPPTSPPTTMTTVPPTVTSVPPGQTQLCFVCGNVTICFTCMIIITPGGGGMIDPRFSQVLSQGNVCSATSIPSCQNTPRSDAPLTDLSSLRNSGTSQECYCVKTWLCSEGNAVIPDGLGVIDSRFTLCSSADQVCCRPAGINLQGFRNADIVVSSSRGLRANEFNRLSPQIACGIRNNSYAPPQSFPPDSEKTYFAEFPWMVAILLKSTTGGPYAFQCGASMVSNGAVLTAAHCVVNQKPEDLIARFGQWNIGNNEQPLPIQEAKIAAIAVHPSYYSGGLFHDVAVLVLTEPVTPSANVLPICLPEQGVVFFPGTSCYGIGWGSNSFGPEGQYQTELRKVNLRIVDRQDCQTRLRGTKLGQYFELHGSFICAGGEANRDTCRGDGGGPLICQAATGQFFQAGIVSWGIGCGASNVPAVYASVSQHRQWIDQQFATYGV